ncbi:AAA domain-containing protein [uncultured Helicobacter sp.]|uniref:AAA domain-containing protein n=1 Tax=uncultured Helicobacter sp. TaxID=175537 RepID=UPI0026387DEB|nr:AAA domain-containing protein [uncultured Helicobacter sp.]
MDDKILGKYTIVKELGQDSYRAKYVNREFDITQIRRDENNESFSYTASKLNHLSHKNLSTIQVEEDEEHFYFIRECFALENLTSEIFMGDYGEEEGKEPDYKRLFECYLQLCGALSYIDKQGFYHGNINPSNILIDTNDEESYQVFLLDFGKSYYYKDLNQEVDGLRFYAPEQIDKDSTPNIKSDIYAFGLCMLKLLLDSFEDCDVLESYKSPKDLEAIYQEVLEAYELAEIENEILLLVRKCCCIEPESRIALNDLEKEILRLYDKAVPKNTYELRCQTNKTLEIYAENNNLDFDKNNLKPIMEHIQEKITGYTAYIRQFEEENKQSGELESKLEIAINDLVFICSADKNDDSYLWVWQVRENEPTRIEKIAAEGLELRHNFVFTTKGYYAPKSCASNIAALKHELDHRFELKKLEIEQNKIDTKAIKSEERLLEAIKKDIDSKKKTHFASLTEIKRGADELILTLIPPKMANDEVKDELESNEDSKESSPKDSKELSQAFKPPFKPKEEVIIQEKNAINSQDDSFKGVVKTYLGDSKKIIIKMKEKYDALFEESKEKELKTKQWAISYDYQVKEILWSKQDTALKELKKGNTQIPNLLRKINDPRELRENKQREIESYFNENLDENQQEAVRKALSLESECEILLIQGPPGTGKTTTITEIIKQYQKFHKHYKILIASQSNQAVDNVLEKICASKDNPNGEDKIFRIGNDKRKMSEIARQYIPEKVLDKILKENRERIEKHTITDQNLTIESKLKKLQQGFLVKLNSLSSEAANTDSTKEKGKRDQETFRLFTKDIRLFFGTLLGISSWKSFRDVAFDVAIVDEAGRATLSELLVPCIKAKRIILVGDHKQLAPVVEDDVIEKLNSKKGSNEFKADKKDVTTSLFERLFERIESSRDEIEYLYNFRHTLTYNYRAHKSICDLYSKAFYQGALQTKPEISDIKAHKLQAFKTNAVWLDTGKRSDKEDTQQGTGKINDCNAKIIADTLSVLKEQILESQKIKDEGIKDIGIITPYKHQSDLLKSKLKSIKDEYKKENISIDIGTVDSFQGSDRDMIIYDCVRSSKANNTQQTQKKRQGGKIDFIADEKRLNVSLSRAKKLLLIVGDKEYLRTASVSEGENPFSAIIKEFDNVKNYQIIELKDSKK